MLQNKYYKEKAHKYIPGGAHTYSRGDDQFPINVPSVLEKGEGAYVWDVDGNKYLDYGMGLRSVTVGYGYKAIADAAITQIYNGNGLTRASKIEIDAAEAMINLIDGADMVKFAKNGSTVTSAAIKLSRAYTGRKYIARCTEHPFFSYDDWFIGSTVVDAGIPNETRALTLQFNYNDISSLEKLFGKYPNEIACVILEPATNVEPHNNFLHEVQNLCHKNNSVFVLDEMITGFRWHLNGAQKYYDIIPDLSTFGKGMANGFSVAAIVGKKEIMELGGIIHDKEKVFLVSTTHGAEMSGLGALVETIRTYNELQLVDYFWNYGNKLKNGINKISTEFGISEYFSIDGTAVSPAILTKDRNGTISFEFRTLFLQEMIKNSILMPYIAISYSHGENELNITLEAARKALSVYRNALDDGVDKYLEGPIVKPVFRKHN